MDMRPTIPVEIIEWDKERKEKERQQEQLYIYVPEHNDVPEDQSKNDWYSVY